MKVGEMVLLLECLIDKYDQVTIERNFDYEVTVYDWEHHYHFGGKTLEEAVNRAFKGMKKL